MTKKTYSNDFKLNVALAAIREEGTLSELSARYDVSQMTIHKWRNIVLQRGSDLFASASSSKPNDKALRDVHAKLGEVTMERDFLLDVSKRLGVKGGKRW